MVENKALPKKRTLSLFRVFSSKKEWKSKNLKEIQKLILITTDFKQEPKDQSYWYKYQVARMQLHIDLKCIWLSVEFF